MPLVTKTEIKVDRIAWRVIDNTKGFGGSMEKMCN